MNPISRGIKNAFRSPIRTMSVALILGLAIGLCLVMMVAHQTVNRKITEVKSNVGNTITIAPAGFSAFSQANNTLSSTEVGKISAIPHVASVTQSLTDRIRTIGDNTPDFGGNSSQTTSTNQTSLVSPVTLNGGGGGGGGGRIFVSGGDSLPTNFTPPITIVGTSDTTSWQGTTLKLLSGTALNGSVDSDSALISSQMATKNSLKLGSTFSAYSTNLTVSGIFDSSTRSTDNSVFVSLPTLQRLSGQSGDVTSVIVSVDSADNLAAVTTAVQTLFGSSADITNSQTQANAAITPLQNIQSISLISLIGAVVAGSVIIFLVTIVIVRERHREIGILKAIGATNFKVIREFMVEAVTLTLIAAVIGLAVGIIASRPVTKTLVSNAASSTGSTNSQLGGGPARFSGNSSFGGQFAGSRNPGGRGDSVVRSTVSNLHVVVGWDIIAYGLLASIVIALIGSGMASYLITNVRPAEVMRTE